MDTTSPSKKAVRVDNQENRMVREKNCNTYSDKHNYYNIWCFCSVRNIVLARMGTFSVSWSM